MANYELPSSLSRRHTAFCLVRPTCLLCAGDWGRKPRVAQVPPFGPAALQSHQPVANSPFIMTIRIHTFPSPSSPPTHYPYVVGSRSYVWGRFFPTYHLRHTIYLLCFQQHSRLQRVTTFVFYNIPALLWPAEGRSFVFIDIRASLCQFLKLLR
jgi:hypothetical protein